ncbi:MAG: VWA domain-containing protein [Myxococcales bacterium]|nr:VWA domain-containing protein [Myxococcales bacterium]
MRLLVPHALLLLLPLLWAVWRTGRLPGPPMWLRLCLVLLVVLALSQPELSLRSAGSDVVVVVDRSKSMPPGSEARAEELIRLLESQRRPGDRIGVVAFGREAKVEAALSERSSFGGFMRALDAEASDVASALDSAGELLLPERSGRVVLISDGRATGVDARAAARRLAARGVAVDHRWLGREGSGLDAAVVSLDVPAAVSSKEPFQFTATVFSSQAAKATVSLTRNGKPLVKGPYELRAGENLLTFRDLVEEPGLVSYLANVEVEGDGVVENDVGRAVLRVEGPPRVLLVTESPGGTLAKTLAEAGVSLEVRAPFAVSMDALDGVGAVVLENVEAGGLSESGLNVLSQYVKEAGGGLVMTGGRKSFGEGGFRKSPVEDLLPVSLEVREEQRKAAVALSIIMDCSCSMGATVPDGRTKMELAAEGVVGALELLNENDEASVAMVDTEPHEIFGLKPVSSGLPLDKVARGFSGGGGIFVGVGLRTARDEVLKSTKATRHVLLFSDAADSEEPDDYLRTLAKLKEEDVTVSVIGLGRRSDPDARLLEEIAHQGGGRIYFAEDAMSLPRIFSQETIAVARATFVDTPAAVRVGPDLGLLGRLSPGGLSSVGGYNLTYLRPRASVGLRLGDDNEAPLLSLWPRGAGKVVAYTGEVDGQFTGAMRGWGGYRSLLEQMVRWTMPPKFDRADLVPRVRRSGNDLHVTVDFDPRTAPPEGAATLLILSGDARAAPIELPMRWEDEDRLGAHFSLPGSGTYHPVAKLGGQVVRAPPVTLPYAPEFEPGSAAEGKLLLGELSKLSGGVERLSMAGVFAETAESTAAVPLSPFLVVLSLAALVAEVVVRRVFAGRKRRAPRSSSRDSSLERAGPPGGLPAAGPLAPSRVEAHLSTSAGLPQRAVRAEPPPADPGAQPPTAEPKKDVRSALELAAERARRRLRR